MKFIKKIFLSSCLFLYSLSLHSADSIGDRLGKIGEELFTFGSFFMLIIGVAGVIFMFLGGMGLKKYADDSRSNPLGRPMIYFLAGALLTGITTFQQMLSKTITGDEEDRDTGRNRFDAGDVY